MTASPSPGALPAARLLIIEDEPVLCHSLQAYLEGLGWDVASAATLEAARSSLAQARFDAVVLDVMLPDGDGLSLLDEIGSERALVVSAFPAPDRYEAVGVRHSMAKPLDLLDVARALGRIQTRSAAYRKCGSTLSVNSRGTVYSTRMPGSNQSWRQVSTMLEGPAGASWRSQLRGT